MLRRGRSGQRVEETEAGERGQARMLRVENVAERIRPLVAKIFRVGKLADAEGVANDHNGTRLVHRGGIMALVDWMWNCTAAIASLLVFAGFFVVSLLFIFVLFPLTKKHYPNATTFDGDRWGFAPSEAPRIM